MQIKGGRERNWVLQDIAEQQGRVGDVAGTERTANQLPRHEEGPAITIVALAKARSGDTRGAIGLVNEISDKFERDLAFYFIAMIQAAKGNKVGARETAASIGNASIRKALLRGITNSKGGEHEVPSVTSIIWRTTNAVRDLAIARALAGDVEGALETAEGAPGVWRHCALITIAAIQARAKDDAAATRIAERIPEQTVTGGRSYRMVAWFHIAIAAAAVGNLEGAVRIASRLNDFLMSHALQAISAAQARGGDVEGALMLTNRVGSPHARARILLGVAEGMVERMGMAVQRASATGPCWPITLH